MKTVYGSKNCPKCLVLKKQLESSNETFIYVDIINLNEEELEALIQKSGTMNLPIILEE